MFEILVKIIATIIAVVISVTLYLWYGYIGIMHSLYINNYYIGNYVMFAFATIIYLCILKWIISPPSVERN